MGHLASSVMGRSGTGTRSSLMSAEATGTQSPPSPRDRKSAARLGLPLRRPRRVQAGVGASRCGWFRSPLGTEPEGQVHRVTRTGCSGDERRSWFRWQLVHCVTVRHTSRLAGTDILEPPTAGVDSERSPVRDQASWLIGQTRESKVECPKNNTKLLTGCRLVAYGKRAIGGLDSTTQSVELVAAVKGQTPREGGRKTTGHPSQPGRRNSHQSPRYSLRSCCRGWRNHADAPETPEL